MSKIEILGYSYQKKLLELIDAENLPVEFGGTCACKGGCKNSDIGPWNDNSLNNPLYPSKAWERLNIEFSSGQHENMVFL